MLYTEIRTGQNKQAEYLHYLLSPKDCNRVHWYNLLNNFDFYCYQESIEVVEWLLRHGANVFKTKYFPGREYPEVNYHEIVEHLKAGKDRGAEVG